MCEGESDGAQDGRTETTSSKDEDDRPYTEPDFETLGSVAAIAEIMRQMETRGGKGNGNKGGNGGRGRGPSGRM